MKKRMIWIFTMGLVLSLSIYTACSRASAEENLELTVYNQNFALVKQMVQANFEAGVNSWQLQDIAASIDPTSVQVVSKTAPNDFRLLEQNFEYDLVSYAKLLEKYIGREIEIEQTAEDGSGKTHRLTGTLLASGGKMLVEVDGKIHAGLPGHVVLPELPDELILKPTLSWLIESAQATSHTLELSYLTNNVKWVADYVATVNEHDNRLNVTGWVTLDNRSGTAYEDATLKLIAGDVRRVQPEVRPRYEKAMMMADARAIGGPQFEEKSFFEYHMYTLGRKTTVKDRETKQVEFLTATDVPVKKEYLCENGGKVQVILELMNSKENGMGMALPKGKVRIYKEDSDSSKQFIGEDQIDHTPKDEEVRLYIGNAFDLKVERKQTAYNVIKHDRRAEESYEISVRNHKDVPVTIKLSEKLYRYQEWKITKTTHEFEKEDARTAETSVLVPADGEVKVAYTVRYKW